MNEAMLLVLDEGTTSTRAMLYTPDGVRVGTAQRDLTQYYPRPGWVEQDATEIWERTLACAQEMVAQAGGADRILAIGITNQRETVVLSLIHISEPTRQAEISYAVFCLKKKSFTISASRHS